MATNTSSKARLDPISHHFAVELREIDALYDLTPRRGIVGASGQWESFTSIIELAETHDRNARVGHWLSVTGAAVGLVGGLILGAVPAVVCAALTAIVSAVGGFITEHMSDAAEYLRACAFASAKFDTAELRRQLSNNHVSTNSMLLVANPVSAAVEGALLAKVVYGAINAASSAGKVEAVVAATEEWKSKNIDRYWHHGDREEFRKNYGAQHDALDQIIYDYDPRLVLDEDFSRLYVAIDVWMPILVGTDTSEWSVVGDLEIGRWQCPPNSPDGSGPWTHSVMKRERVTLSNATIFKAESQLNIDHSRTFVIPLTTVPQGPERFEDVINIGFNGTITAVVQGVRVQQVRPITIPRALKSSMSIAPYRRKPHGPVTPWEPTKYPTGRAANGATTPG